jgi:hypothetical protein
MSGGTTPMRLRLAVVLALLAGPVVAEPAPCPDLKAALEAATESRMTAPVAGPVGDWCVFDGAVLQAEGAPDVATARLRLRGQVTDGALTELALEASGVRVKPGFGARDMDPTLRETLRLQTADISFVAVAGPEGLALRDGELHLSGGTELKAEADVAGAGLSAGGLVAGRLTRLDLDWRNDGKLLRPGMQALGERLVDGARGDAGIDAARLALRHLAMNLPGSLFQEDGQDRLETVLDAMPQGRGRLRLEFRSDKGIGAAQVGMAALSGDPLGPEALARLFDGAQLLVDWTPGIAP